MSLGPVMLDIDGLALSPADRDLLREPAVGGVILFTRNFESPEQIANLVEEIRALRSPPLLMAVDQEGGRVQRFREGFTELPPMRRIGREFDRDSESLTQSASFMSRATRVRSRAMRQHWFTSKVINSKQRASSICSRIQPM